MRKIKVVQIGLEHDHALVVFDSLLRQTDIFEVVGFAVPESEKTDFPERIERYKERVPFISVEEALNYSGLDAAVIETEEVNLTKYALMAAEKGLHIHMDKPGGIDLPVFEKLIETVKNNNSVFHLGYMYRYNPFVIEAMQKIRDGELGEIYSVEAHMSCWHNKGKTQWLERFPGGMLFFLGCHLVDLIVQIQGVPEEIIPLSVSTGAEGTTSEDLGMAVFKYKNGVSFVKACASEPGGFTRRQLVVCGTKGTVEIKPFEYMKPDNGSEQYTDMREVYSTEWHAWGDSKTTEPYNRYDSMTGSFAQMVAGEKKNPWSYEYELELYKILLEACGGEKYVH